MQEIHSIKREVGYRLKMARLMRGYTQQDIADTVGKTINAISQWENGNSSPPADCLLAICSMLSITPNQVYGIDDCPDLRNYIMHTHQLDAEIKALEKQKAEIEAKIKQYSNMKSHI